MACNINTLTGLNTRCKESSFGGIKEVYIAFHDMITTTVDADTHTIVPELLSGGYLYEYKLMKNSAILNTTFDSETNLFTNEITLEFDKLDTVKSIELNILVHAPIAVIFLDANGKYWYLGKDEPVQCSTATLTTGQASSDRNYMSITFSCYSIESPYEVLKDDMDDLFVDYSREYLTLIVRNNHGNSGDLYFYKPGSSFPNVQYSFDKQNWTTMSASTMINVHQSSKVKVYLRGVNPDGLYDGDEGEGYTLTWNGTPQSNASVKVAGNIMSLINYNTMSTATTVPDYAFDGFFNGFGHLVDASDLVMPATTLGEYCYRVMFEGCTDLVYPPDELPNSNLQTGCYDSMFLGCTKLVKSPDILTTSTEPEAYADMFKNCSNLKYVKCLLNDSDLDGTTVGWMTGVSNTGTFVKHPNMTGWERGVDGIPVGWKVINA